MRVTGLHDLPQKKIYTNRRFFCYTQLPQKKNTDYNIHRTHARTTHKEREGVMGGSPEPPRPLGAYHTIPYSHTPSRILTKGRLDQRCGTQGTLLGTTPTFVEQPPSRKHCKCEYSDKHFNPPPPSLCFTPCHNLNNQPFRDPPPPSPSLGTVFGGSTRRRRHQASTMGQLWHGP